MAIHSTPFGPVKLTGEDAKAFLRKVRYGRGNKAASESWANGRKLVAVFAREGKVTVELKLAKADARNQAAAKE